MNLQVWLPLNGDLTQQGTENTTFSGTPTWKTYGKIGNTALNLQNRITCTTTALNGVQFFSVAFWARIENNPDSTVNWMDVIGFTDQTSSGVNGQFRFETGYGNSAYSGIHWHDNATNAIISGSYTYNTGTEFDKWHHIAVTISDTAVCSYYDGVLKSTLTANLNKGHLTGAWWLGESTTRGCIQDVRIYDHALSAAEVKEISQGLVLHYKLDDLTNGVVDSSGYNHNGILTNTTLITSNTPRYSNAIYLSKIKINCADGFPTGENPNFTISFWTKILSTISYVSYGDLIGMYDTGQGGNTFRLELCGSPAGNNLMWFRGPSGQSGGGFNMNSSSSSGWFIKDIWHHIVLTGDGINKKYYCYLDGNLCQTYNGSANSWQPTGQWYLGDTIEATAYFSDLRIYCTTLDADAIRQLYEVSAKVDNLQNLHTFELVENNLKTEINKRGQLICNGLNEDTATKFYKSGNLIETNEIIEC